MNAKDSLKLGSNVIALMMPHRAPFVMVDCVTAFAPEPQPRLKASRHITQNEPVFAGHFPDLHLWPGVYTQEGMGQSCYLVSVIMHARRFVEAEGGDPDQVLGDLRNLELGYKLHPGFDAGQAERTRTAFRSMMGVIGVAATANIRYVKPVFAGQRLDYDVTVTHEIDNQMRYSTQAFVDGELVAKGTLTSYVGMRMPLVADAR